MAKPAHGNRRFLADQISSADITAPHRLEIAKSQSPFAVLGRQRGFPDWSEHLFGGGLGELFIGRTAGNSVDNAGYGSISYDVLHWVRR